MSKTFYTVIENQIRPDGSYGLLYDHYYEDENATLDAATRAYAKFYNIAAAAVVSGIPYHSAQIIRSDGITIEGRVWDRRVDPVPETPDDLEEE